MTNAQRLALRLSEIRQKLNELSGKDELTEAETEEMRRLSGEYPKLEERHRGALIAESVEEAEALDGEDGDGEDRERSELRSRSRLARYVSAALDGVPVQGAEAELSAAAGCPGAVPLELFEVRRSDTGDPERRAVTPARPLPRTRTYPASSRLSSIARRRPGSVSKCRRSRSVTRVTRFSQRPSPARW